MPAVAVLVAISTAGSLLTVVPAVLVSTPASASTLAPASATLMMLVVLLVPATMSGGAW